MSRRPQSGGSSRAGSSILGDFGLAGVPWLVSRALVLAALAVSRHLTDRLGVAPRPIALRQGLLGWDAAFYGDIARGGYAAVSHGSVKNEGLRFFPLLPLAGRAVGLLPFVDARGGVVVVANLAALVGAALLIRLVTFETGDRALGQRSAAVLLLAPHAFVFVMGYADALMCALAIAFFLCVRRQHWWWAVVVGFAAGLCRPVGVLLVLPALIEAVQVFRRERGFRLGPVVATVAPLGGLASYLLWARARTGDLFLVLRLQNSPNLRGGTVSPFTSVDHAFHELFSGDRIGYGLHAITAVVVVVLVVVVARRLALSYTVYSAASVLVSLCARNLDSIERYSLATFPLVIGAAVLLRRPTWERTAMLLLAGGLVAASMLAFTGSFVP
jgi:hypothetical protein